jgi:hypothetical protein
MLQVQCGESSLWANAFSTRNDIAAHIATYSCIAT